jgi:RNA polymerase sigma-70 factor (ECF subfamily)
VNASDSTRPTGEGAGTLDARLAAVWRVESPRVIARLARLVGDLGAAEDIAQDAFVTAIQKWRAEGIPPEPAAWLHRTARYLAIDRIRRQDAQQVKYRELAAGSSDVVAEPTELEQESSLADDLLGLIFMACHPVLSADAKSALTLKLVCGLTTEEVSRALLTPQTTLAQRIVRAKRTLRAAKVRFELPEAAERLERLAAVREVIYLLFNEGYAATSGPSWVRRDLCHEAQRLARMLAALTPDDTETLGLLALLEIQASRLAARTDSTGEPVLLMDQDRSRWDQLLIRRGLALIERVEQLGGTTGSYALQAAIAAGHARAQRPADTDWHRITALYDALVQVAPSPVVQLNRALAASRAYGPAEGLSLLAQLMTEPALGSYHLLPAAAGDMTCLAGDHPRAREYFLQAAGIAVNPRDRAALQRRAADCIGHGEQPVPKPALDREAPPD